MHSIRWARCATSKVSSTQCQSKLETEVSLWTRIKCFPSILRRRNLKTQQSPVVLDLYLSKIRSKKSRDYRDVKVFEKLPFQVVFCKHENASVLGRLSWCLFTRPLPVGSLCSSSLAHLTQRWTCSQVIQFKGAFSFSWRISVSVKTKLRFYIFRRIVDMV